MLSLSDQTWNALFALGTLVSGVVAILAMRSAQRAAARATQFDWDEDFLDWVEDAISGLTEAITLSMKHGPQDPRAANDAALDLAGDLSALVDRGRMFFPNAGASGRGGDGPAAYQGTAPSLFDPLKDAVLVLCEKRAAAFHNREAAEFLWEARREFVSEAQALLNPKWRLSIASKRSARAEHIQRLSGAPIDKVFGS